jgi:RNA polymerase-binding transcription factor DksA/cold shock CspA family protein/ribosome-associated translation inhibitor RaiA
MQLPIGITFRNIAKSQEMEDIILAHASKLNEFYDRVIRCDVVVELPHKHHRKGNALQVRVDVTYPGGEIIVSRAPERWADQSFTTVVGEAFDAARRQILEVVRRRHRNRVKLPEFDARAWVARLLPEQSYGFLETVDGREVYFHRSSVLNDGFDRLTVGMEVSFVEAESENGPRASTVRPVGRHHQVLGPFPGRTLATTLPIEDQERYRAVLTDLMHRLDQELDSIEDEGLQPAGGEASGGFSNVPLHLADLAAHEYDTSVNVGLAQNEQQLRREVDLALARLDAGTFGECEHCMAPVGKERLDAIPYARFCVECAKEAELTAV